MILPSWSKPSAGTGASKTPCLGCSTSPSARTTVACATVPPPATSPSCARSPSTSSPETAVTEPADAVGAKWRPGTTTTCSRSSLAKLMRELWPLAELARYCEIVAAMKLRTTNKKTRHLLTARALELMEQHGIETPDGLVQPPVGLLR